MGKRALITRKTRKRGLRQGTYHNRSHALIVIAIITDHIATASICNLRFLGICAGTKLETTILIQKLIRKERTRKSYLRLA